MVANFYSTKSYGHELGLSAAFRQWRADSHCNKIHGYALAFTFTFGCSELDDRNWCMDFGALKPIKQWLQDTFDHKTLVAYDDPNYADIEKLHELGVLDMVLVHRVGCEAFAELAFNTVDSWLTEVGQYPRVWVQRVEVKEHSGNSAIYEKDQYTIQV